VGCNQQRRKPLTHLEAFTSGTVGNAEHTFEINESCVKTSNGSYSGIFLVQKTNTKLKTTNNHEPGSIFNSGFEDIF